MDDGFMKTLVCVSLLIVAAFVLPKCRNECDDACGGPGRGVIVRAVLNQYTCVCRAKWGPP